MMEGLAECCGSAKDGELPPLPQVVEWEDLQCDLGRLCGIATLLIGLRERKEALAQDVRRMIQANSESLRRMDALHTLERRLVCKEEYYSHAKSCLEKKTQELISSRQRLMASGNTLLYSAKCLNAARSRLQEVSKLLAGEEGHGRLKLLRSLLTVRRRCMVAQLASLYPLLPCGTSSKIKCPANAHAYQSGDSRDCMAMTILGLHVIPPLKREAAALFSDKRQSEASATALGYVAHVVKLLGRYLDVRLRYPVRFQASRSFIQDFSPPGEAATRSSGGAVVLPETGDNAMVEFPLFSDGQDPTRAAYAVFLLNKDLEQILNRLGVSSLGPRHVLPNLHRILRTIFQDARVLA